jgi:hypothetical protein
LKLRRQGSEGRQGKARTGKVKKILNREGREGREGKSRTGRITYILWVDFGFLCEP